MWVWLDIEQFKLLQFVPYNYILIYRTYVLDGVNKNRAYFIDLYL